MATFAELIIQYTLRIGIADAELARKIGVRRQTIFRWKEGLVKRPRDRQVVLDTAKALRLTPEERDGLLLAAGFAPESMPEVPSVESFPQEIVSTEDEPISLPDVRSPISAREDEPISVSVSLPEPPPTAYSSLGQSSTEPANDVPSSIPSPIPSPARSPVIQQSMKRLVLLSGIAIPVLVGFVYFTFFQNNGSSTEMPSLTATAEAQITQEALAAIVAPTAIPTVNPMAACLPEKEDEILVLVSRFVPYGTKRYNVAGRVLEALEAEGKEEELAALRIALYKDEITTSNQAEKLIADCSAAVLIWGEYDDGRVVAQTTSVKDARRQFPADLPTVFDVNVPAEVRVLALEALGIVLRTQDRYAEAAASFKRALTKLPDTPPNVPTNEQRYNLYFYLGRVLYGNGLKQAQRESFDDAIEAYGNAVELAKQLNKPNPALLYNRGITYLDRYRGFPDDDEKKVDLDLAIADLDAALRIKGPKWNVLAAYTMRGITHMARQDEGDIDAAIRDFSASITLDPKPDYYYNRALAHIWANNVASWESDLDKALELKHPARTIYTAKCFARLRQAQAEEAIAACEAALEEEPKAADTTYVNYAIALAATGDTENAIAYLTTHIEWLNANPGYYQRLAGELADEWLTKLEAGEQPFGEETLRTLE